MFTQRRRKLPYNGFHGEAHCLVYIIREESDIRGEHISSDKAIGTESRSAGILPVVLFGGTNNLQLSQLSFTNANGYGILFI